MYNDMLGKDFPTVVGIFPHAYGAYSPCLWGKLPIGMEKVGIALAFFFDNRITNNTFVSRCKNINIWPNKK